MKNDHQHIKTAVVSRSPGNTYGHMYSMHKYWSKKSPDVVAAYIKSNTEEGDIVLDPFCGSGITACEAVRLNRRAIAIDINPMATFITRLTLTPVNLSRLQWAFRDVESKCEEAVSELFVTTCRRCRGDAVVEFVVRDGDVPTQIAYKCNCSHERLFKDPDMRDKSLDSLLKNEKIPFWYPRDVLLPVIQKERFQYLHELFTRRNLIALSTILNAIEEVEDSKTRDVMKLAFTAALDKCSRLKPLSRARSKSRPSLSEGWIAVRFYAPRMWQEVNPWHAFARSFERVYKGKKESNSKLKRAVIRSSYEDLRAGRANVVIFTGSADDILNEQLPQRSVHYVLTDPPFGAHIQYLALSTFWGAWLKFNFDYEKELVVARHQGKTPEDYERHLGEILKSIRRVISPSKYVHIFYHDVRGPYFHKMLRLMPESKIVPERVLHQPPANSFGAALRIEERIGAGEGHYGSYIVTGRAINKANSVKHSIEEALLTKKVAEAARMALQIRVREGSAPVAALLHSIYQSLREEEILAFAQYPAEEFIKQSIKDFAMMNKTRAQLKEQKIVARGPDIRREILDARTLYVNNPKDKKHQVYQRVLSKFQEDGITIDDIRIMEGDIQESEVIEHRKHRLPKLLYLLGEILGFECQLTNETDNEIIWKGDDETSILFRVTDKEVVVGACRTVPEGNIASEVGTISDEELENALLKWCQENPKKGDKLIKDLNSMGKSTIPSTSTKHLLLKVLENKELCSKHHLISLRLPERHDIEIQPGQFLHVICDPDGKRTLTDDGKERGYALTLRRPFSVHRVHYTDFDRRLLATPNIIPYEIKEVIKRPTSKIDILYKVVGKGTENLSKVLPGRWLDVIGPIGNGFEIEKVETAVIVAGGIGVAPLMALAERLRYLGSKIFLYFGALRMELLRPLLSRADSAIELGFANGTGEFLKLINNELKEIGAERVEVCTDDGSLGEKGLVPDILERDIKSGALPSSNINIYACGPPKMMEAVSNVADRYKVPCQVLLEERMACGIGACFSCTCYMRGSNGEMEKKRVCVDGPAFKSKNIIWQD